MPHFISLKLLLFFFFFSLSLSLASSQQVIHEACKASRDPPACEDLFSHSSIYNLPPNATALEVIQFALNLKGRVFAQKILTASRGNPNRSNAATSCLDMLDYSKYRINMVGPALTRGRKLMKEARAWMSAALVYQYDCWSALKLGSAPTPDLEEWVLGTPVALSRVLVGCCAGRAEGERDCVQRAGLYEETVRVPLEKKNVVFWGNGMGKTVISGSMNVGQPGMSTYNSATVGVVGERFMASNLTIKNEAGSNAHQAVAFRSDSDQSVMDNCEFIGIKTPYTPTPYVSTTSLVASKATSTSYSETQLPSSKTALF
ncbi:probable pectinesterase/pectinesterase inhibitor 64 [Phtheirospermum japonicum]|uniref:Probable pectinesterase/pectinesterase inhibitor 64 n=1 Tax=Phtheirospermum japonicum TaxID=374723 RepID=A0A830B5C5_9LAMI|nr:probable pectinesterase/pectinesterase inhibitor 64 [Phtheirospermum japonicum]